MRYLEIKVQIMPLPEKDPMEPIDYDGTGISCVIWVFLIVVLFMSILMKYFGLSLSFISNQDYISLSFKSP